MTVKSLMRNLGEMYGIDELKNTGNMNILNDIVDTAIDKHENPDKYPVNKFRYFNIITYSRTISPRTCARTTSQWSRSTSVPSTISTHSHTSTVTRMHRTVMVCMAYCRWEDVYMLLFGALWYYCVIVVLRRSVVICFDLYVDAFYAINYRFTDSMVF